MLLFRSISIGLLGACFLLLATHSTTVRVEREIERVPVVQPRPPAAATIIDVAPGLSPAQIVGLIHVDGDEHIIAVDDRSMASDLEVGTAIASTHDKKYLDLTVGGAYGERRILVLMH
jgi:hypothetical protein